MQANKVQVEELAREVQRGDQDHESVMRVAKMRRSITNDMKTIETLRQLAFQIKERLEEIKELRKEQFSEEEKEELKTIYEIFKHIGGD